MSGARFSPRTRVSPGGAAEDVEFTPRAYADAKREADEEYDDAKNDLFAHPKMFEPRRDFPGWHVKKSLRAKADPEVDARSRFDSARRIARVSRMEYVVCTRKEMDARTRGLRHGGEFNPPGRRSVHQKRPVVGETSRIGERRLFEIDQRLLTRSIA